MIEEFVYTSRLRQLTLLLLVEGRKQVSELSSELGKSLQSTSRTLRELREKDLVRCTTPERHSNRVYEITDKGEQVLEQMPTKLGHLRSQRFELKVTSTLDRAGLPYARNQQIDGGIFKHRPDFVVEGSGEFKVVVEVKRVSDRSAIPTMKRVAFTSEDLKERNHELKTVLVVGGTSRESRLGYQIQELEHHNIFDRVLFEEELEDLTGYLKELMEGEA